MRTAIVTFALLLLLAPRGWSTTVNVTVNSDFYNTTSNVPGMGTPNPTVNVGDTITWTWVGSDHSVTSDTLVAGKPLFDSGVHNAGNVFSFTFTSAGTFPYHCVIHGVCCNMKGTITVVPVAVNVSGTVALMGSTNLAQTLMFEFRPSVGSPIDRMVTLNTDGTYTIANVPVGTYTLAIKGDRWLQKDISGLDATTGDVTGLDVSLIPGDINGDNVIDINDFSLLAQSFGLAIGDAGFIDTADLDCNGVVDINDFSLLAANFGDGGDP